MRVYENRLVSRRYKPKGGKQRADEQNGINENAISLCVASSCVLCELNIFTSIDTTISYKMYK
jgi:hypothetical protein